MGSVGKDRGARLTRRFGRVDKRRTPPKAITKMGTNGGHPRKSRNNELDVLVKKRRLESGLKLRGKHTGVQETDADRTG